MKFNILMLVLAGFFTPVKGGRSHAMHDIYYTCSMHRTQVSDKPENAPFVHMDLVPVEEEKNADLTEIILNDEAG